MNERRLREIERRAEKATPGQWFIMDEGDVGAFKAWRINSEQDRSEEAAICSGVDCNHSEADKDFIANARLDVPALCAEIRRLRGLLRK